jgi:hypothetical protein
MLKQKKMDKRSLIFGRRGSGINWEDFPGHLLIKSATLEWTDTWFYCDKCNVKVHLNLKSKRDNWHCTNTIGVDEDGDDIKCDGDKLVSVLIPQSDTFTSEQLEFWKAFQSKK